MSSPTNQPSTQARDRLKQALQHAEKCRAYCFRDIHAGAEAWQRMEDAHEEVRRAFEEFRRVQAQEVPQKVSRPGTVGRYRTPRSSAQSARFRERR